MHTPPGPSRQRWSRGRPARSWWVLAVLAVLWAVLPDPGTAAVTHPQELVPADHWTYATLYRLASRRLAPLWAASTRPMTRMEITRMVARALDMVAAARDRLTPPDLEDATALATEFAAELRLMGYRSKGPVRVPPAPFFNGWQWQIEAGVLGRAEAGEPPWLEGPRRGSQVGLEVRGVVGLGDELAVGADVNSGLTFGPYSRGRLQRLYLSGELLGASLQVGRDTPWWGPGSRGAFLLSDNTGPIDFLRLSIASERMRLVKLLSPHDYTNRYLYGLRVDWWLRDNIRLGFGETVLSQGGIYAPYALNPLPLLNQGFSLDRLGRSNIDDNYSFSLDMDWNIARDIILYLELLADDISAPSPGATSSPHRIGGTVGLYVNNPFGMARTELRLEHGRVNNWVYVTGMHTTDYIRYGRALGHWIAPDGELWSAAVTRRLPGGGSIRLAYDLLRKGEGQLGQMWSSEAERWAKVYLSGVVETTHALQLSYTWPQAPHLDQMLSATWWTASNAGHVAGQTRQEWFLQWRVRYGF